METLTLTDAEKSLVWSKLEYRKKKQAIETLNELHTWFHGPKTEFSREERTKILKSLEYTFKKKLVSSTVESTSPDSQLRALAVKLL